MYAGTRARALALGSARRRAWAGFPVRTNSARTTTAGTPVRWLSCSPVRWSPRGRRHVSRYSDDDPSLGRGRSRSQALPSVTLPAWFLEDRVRLYEPPSPSPLPPPPPTTYRQDLEQVRTLLFAPPPGRVDPDTDPHAAAADDGGQDAAATLAGDWALYWDDWLDAVAWTNERVAAAKAHLASGALGRGQEDAGLLDRLVARRGAAVALVASYAVAAQGATSVPDPHDVLQLPHFLEDPAARTTAARLALPWNAAARRVVLARAAMLADHDAAAEASGRGALSAGHDEPPVLDELVATVRAELGVPGKRAAGHHTSAARPLPVLTLVNHCGHSKARALVDRVAARVAADVVHLDARALAAVLAPALGQSVHAGRGNVALLGYAAAHLSGQLAVRYGLEEEVGEEDEEDEPYEGEEGEGEEGRYEEDAEEYSKEVFLPPPFPVPGGGGSSSSSKGPFRKGGVLIMSRSGNAADLARKLFGRAGMAARGGEEDEGEGGEVDNDDDDDLGPMQRSRHDELDDLQPYPSLVLDPWADRVQDRVVEALVAAVGEKRGKTATETTTAPPLLVHLHNFLELSALRDGEPLVRKLRAAVDRRWRAGQPVVLLGSSAARLHQPSISSGTGTGTVPLALLRQAEALRHEKDCHMVPYRVAPGRPARLLERRDCLEANLGHVGEMVAAMTADAKTLDLAWVQRLLDGIDDDEPSVAVRRALSRHVLDIHWVYRFAALLVGGGVDGEPVLNADALARTLAALDAQNQQWHRLAGAQAPYYAPLTSIRPQYAQATRGARFDDEEAEEDLFESSETQTSSSPRRRQFIPAPSAPAPSPPAKQYTDDEKKFLTGLIDADTLRTTFDDVVLPDETKDALRALTSLSLERPDAFTYGVLATERIPGCLLYGPPGTGKTLLAKAVAKQSGAAMLEVSAASINDMWVGASERNVQALFALARKLAPVVVFLDEADALLGARVGRGGNPGGGGGSRRETINQFLKEWDGVGTTSSSPSKPVFIMVATNRPFDLDDAVLRRLPRRLLVDLPRADARLAILRNLLRDETLDADAAAALPRLAAADTELYSGSDLKNLCVAAAMEAVRDEVRAQTAHTGPEPFVFPPRRVLRADHFARALQAIGASISEDMPSLRAIRRFDERYGDNTMAGVDGDGKPRRRRRKRRGMGFEIAAPDTVTEDALVRQPG